MGLRNGRPDEDELVRASLMVDRCDQIPAGTNQHVECRKRTCSDVRQVQKYFYDTILYVWKHLHLPNSTKKHLIMYHLGKYLNNLVALHWIQLLGMKRCKKSLNQAILQPKDINIS